jgi:hypothetical protein
MCSKSTDFGPRYGADIQYVPLRRCVKPPGLELLPVSVLARAEAATAEVAMPVVESEARPAD